MSPVAALVFLKQKNKIEKACSHKYIHRKMPVTVSFLLQLQVLGLTVLRKMETNLDVFVKFEEFY